MADERGDGGDSEAAEPGQDFVRRLIAADLEAGRHRSVVTRFPPEPNGYLHIGHAVAVCLDFGVAEEFGGHCNLRFDDTNPETEDPRYVAAIQEDIRWLGFDWGERERYASDYYEQLYEWAVALVDEGLAYVDDLSEAEIRDFRGTVTEPGRPSPHRDRSVTENLDLLARMRAGEFADGARVLRAKIDMAHPNMKMRDPLMYRIRHATHYRRGDDWCIYPFYDWAHGQSDAIEGVTHSLCSLEFESNRELYDWYLDHLELPGTRPRQYEFARFNLDYAVTSKRKLLRLVEDGLVDGWDDPRMPTIAGLRRRGVTPAAVRSFCDLVGVNKSEGRADMSMFEYAIRDDLNHRAPRVMCVLRPLRVVLTNWPAGGASEDGGGDGGAVEMLDAPHWPHDVPRDGSRPVPFSGELFIEREDFMEEPPSNYFRLAPGREVRLRYGYVIRCEQVVKDAAGEVTELRCAYDPETRGGATPDGRRVRGTIHWVSAPHAVPVVVRLYDRLFAVADPGAERDIVEDVNHESLVVVEGALAEPSLSGIAPGTHVQFERLGYFFTDPVTSTPGAAVFNRVVTLRDSWARANAEAAAGGETEAAGSRATAAGAVSGDGSAGEGAVEAPARRRRKRSPVAARQAARSADPELGRRYERYRVELGVSESDADVLSGNRVLSDLFEAAIAAPADAASVAKWIVNEVLRATRDDDLEGLPFAGAALGRLVARVDEGAMSSAIAKEVFAIMVRDGGDPDDIVARHGLRAVTDTAALAPIVERLMASNPDKVEALRDGRDGLMGFFVGQVMRETDGAADAQVVQQLVRDRL